MKIRQYMQRAVCAAGLSAALLITGCGKTEAPNEKAEAPPPVQVLKENDASLVKVDKPEQFPVVAADTYDDTPVLEVTGVVSPDVSRNVPVISVASGRIVEVDTRLGDQVKKGQLLMKVQSVDLASAFSDYQHAVADEVLARAQLERAKILLDKGALAAKDQEVAQDVEDKAKVDLTTSEERLKVLGADANNPTPVVPVYAPISGVVTDQLVTAAAGTQGLASPNAFTISDLSHVWIMCDVYENDLSFVHLGEFADIKLNAFPGRTFRGRIGNIGSILDPNIRTAKVRLEIENPGLMRLGMFATAVFHASQKVVRATVPASAVLHLHDRDWVYTPVDGANGEFRRLEVVGGRMVPPDRQEINSGLRPGDRVVRDALILQNTAEQ
ncbi:MAG TPA: efflux RND transporter periplasmic adaptor subunit [Bryobacteraceae bacterium]|nr:efflux RND transporter periplasmic adaptor subunit [Bryobacteraceae bacterium]